MTLGAWALNQQPHCLPQDKGGVHLGNPTWVSSGSSLLLGWGPKLPTLGEEVQGAGVLGVCRVSWTGHGHIQHPSLQ